ncbi:hypothetical protein SAMN02745174_01178 [Cetobacterium ceti]|uniref:Uncharacterized protein n=1 Tax=Cetobacterium ceti TaxID=180163 RepID=A0A1T4ME13_9FUSO|nr:hypothetical protein [Cetobacterium ceti]SJZ65182.1 hypothetical protein SAMN02745174_01178 [Cetobacterium ceti]
MKRTILKTILLFSMGALFFACEGKKEEPKLEAGSYNIENHQLDLKATPEGETAPEEGVLPLENKEETK